MTTRYTPRDPLGEDARSILTQDLGWSIDGSRPRSPLAAGAAWVATEVGRTKRTRRDSVGRTRCDKAEVRDGER